MRVDAGLARLLGLSRTAAAALAEDGGVDVDGARAGKSDKLTAGAWLEVRLPEAPAPVENTPVEIEGMSILYSDADIVAVDKPPGVAAHATVGWHGPTVLGGLAAAGFRISTSGIHERQGIVQRLDVGTSGVMVVALSERAYTVLKRAFKARTVDKRYHALVQGHPDPSSGTIDAPIGRHRGNDWKFAVIEGGRHSVTHYDTLEAHQAASLLDVRSGNWSDTPDSGAFRGPAPSVRRRPHLRRRPDAGEASLGWSANGCTPGPWRSRIPPTGGASRSPAPTQRTCSTHSTCCGITNSANERAALRHRRLCDVGRVPRVLSAAETRGRARGARPPDRVDVPADGRRHRGGAPASRHPRDHTAGLAAAGVRIGADLHQLGDLHLRRQQRPCRRRRAGLFHQPAGDCGAGAVGLSRAAQSRAVHRLGHRRGRRRGVHRRGRRTTGHRARAGAVVRPLRCGEEGGADRSAGAASASRRQWPPPWRWPTSPCWRAVGREPSPTSAPATSRCLSFRAPSPRCRCCSSPRRRSDCRW